MKKRKGLYRSRVVHWSAPDQGPEVDIDRISDSKDALIKNLWKLQYRALRDAFSTTKFPAENMSAASPARVEKVVRGERLR